MDAALQFQGQPMQSAKYLPPRWHESPLDPAGLTAEFFMSACSVTQPRSIVRELHLVGMYDESQLS